MVGEETIQASNGNQEGLNPDLQAKQRKNPKLGTDPIVSPPDVENMEIEAIESAPINHIHPTLN